MVRHIANQQSDQSRYANVEQEPQWHVICAEIDSAHSKQLEIDEQQQNVIDADFVLMEHVNEGGDACVDSDRTDPKKRKVMEQLNPEVPKAVCPSMNPNAHPIRPIHTFSPNTRRNRQKKLNTAI